jgi:hypothetical protein
MAVSIDEELEAAAGARRVTRRELRRARPSPTPCSWRSVTLEPAVDSDLAERSSIVRDPKMAITRGNERMERAWL